MSQIPSTFVSRTVPRILYELSRGPLRFNALQRAADLASARMLSQSLKKLERDGILTRTVMKAEPPAVVTYALTPLGRELQKSTSALVDFWNKNQAEICERRFINAEVARAAELRADEPGAGASA